MWALCKLRSAVLAAKVEESARGMAADSETKVHACISITKVNFSTNIARWVTA